MRHYCIMLTKDQVQHDDFGGKEEGEMKRNKKRKK